MYVYKNELREDDGTILCIFSSHKAATQAMIRINNPDIIKKHDNGNYTYAENTAIEKIKESKWHTG